MRKSIFFALLACMAVGGLVEAGQFRIAPPQNLRKRPPPPGRRESRLEIVNKDDRGYAIDVDYRRNRLQLEHRARGDIYVPGNSSVTLVFDDDDNWHILGDDESLEIEIRAGRTSTLRLETRSNRNRIGLFATVENGRRHDSVQLFKYADRPGRPGPNPGAHKPAPTPPAPPPPAHKGPPPAPPAHKGPPPTPPPSQPHRGSEPSKGAVIGAIVGGAIGGIIDDDKDGRPGHRR